MEIIQSEQNQWLKKLKSLQQKKHREQLGQFVIEGSRFVQEAIACKSDLEAILVAEDYLEGNLTFLTGLETPVYPVKSGLLEKALNTVTPQGIAAIVSKPQWSWEAITQMEKILIIDGVQDPGNLGTIIRTALASNTQGVFCLKGTVDLYNDKVLRSTMGAIFTLPIYQVEAHQGFLQELHQLGFTVVVADIRGESYYYDYEFPVKTALVVGNEGHGPMLVTQGDYYVKIPLHPQAESLNVAVATGILLYDLERQKQQKIVQPNHL